MNLYEINANILACVDEETGELFDPEAFEQLQLEKTEKIENLACWVKNLEAYADALNNEKKSIGEKLTKVKNRIDGIKRYMSDNFAGEKLQTGKVSVGWRSSESVEVSEIEKIPKQYLTFKVVIEPDKTAIKKAIKDGAEIEGCELVKKQNIQIK